MLLEGMSIRSCERLTGLHRDTNLGIMVQAGESCSRFLETAMSKHCDYLQMIKHFQSTGSGSAAVRYSPGSITSVERKVICGHVAEYDIGTSRMERLNLTTRMQVQRSTSAHSKTARNHDAMLSLYFSWYSFCRKHSTIKTTPAVKAGLADSIWTMEALLTVASAA